MPRHRNVVALALCFFGGSSVFDASAQLQTASQDDWNRLAVMRVSFRNFDNSTSIEQAGWLLKKAARYFHDQSYGQVSLTGDVFEIHAQINHTCDFFAVMNDIIKAGGEEMLSDYDRVLLLIPTTGLPFGPGSCPHPGISTIRKIHYPGIGHPISVSAIFGEPHLGIIAHEMGHAFGATHSGSVNCFLSVPGLLCGDEEYGDELDPMGNHYNDSDDPPPMNAWDRMMAGWIHAEVADLSDGQRHVYRLSPVARSSGHRLLGIRPDYAVEYVPGDSNPLPVLGFFTNNHAGALVYKINWKTGRAEAINMSPLRRDYSLAIGDEWHFDEDGFAIKAEQVVDGELEISLSPLPKSDQNGLNRLDNWIEERLRNVSAP